ncbi:ATP-dependent DNA ligase [Pseudoclavibacter endophyticus]|uniref:DNA ligase (ATP) n=1 Tax=Pseudoclavibacter endophyticus TaxID=1778590 RepID=A0A6H9WFG8_9MICO|nr:ATP-dependent DNA ligase [Pseudoclavibacter endophyticus]KAB1646878.1 ATP-dependent DNA ligase [Pseudoclavibacter endophyticus]GGA74769.1 ATP-dependent DNA ligase [Pseudoclavibacter endophyticus]
MARTTEQRISIDGKKLRLSNLDRVLYPATGTTKRDVIDYYRRIAPVMLPHCRDRPVTRKRWPGGVGEDGGGEVFFQKNIGQGAPDWVERRSIQHSDHVNEYPLANDVATLAWFGQMAALEIHVPQWRFGEGDEHLPPDRIVFDLDPGEGVGLRECVEVARLVRGLLRDMGLDPVPVTSGSKGIHLYAGLDGTQSSEQVSGVAKELARALEADHPDDVISSMRRSARAGKVFIDWSQNNASKTTIAPYSLRGRRHPHVAAPRTWRELASPQLRQLDLRDVLARVKRRGDPMAGLEDARGDGTASDGVMGRGGPVDRDADPPPRDRLTVYRTKRDASRTPEPVPDRHGRGGDGPPSFVIQRHQARRLHFDFRLEHEGVLVSWALPKGVPTDPKRNHLAVPTEDHPLEYGEFEGEIPKGEYGAGVVEIWDAGTYELEKWEDGEVIATLTGREDGGLGGRRKYALFRTGDDPQKPQWMIHRMQLDDESGGEGGATTREPASAKRAPSRRSRAAPARYRPMLAVRGEADALERLDQNEWAFEMKWDGMRAIVTVDDKVTVHSRNARDVTVSFPELDGVVDAVDTESCVLDGEIVAFGGNGAPDFGRLQRRMHVTNPREAARLRNEVPVSLVVFDVLEINGSPSVELPYANRRELLDEVVHDVDGLVLVPPAFDGDVEAAVDSSSRFGLEGIMAKRLESPYRPGRRSSDWRKVAHVQTAEVVVIGWRPSSADPSGLASLLLAVPTADGLRYAGRVGTGFSASQRREIRRSLERLARKTPPADGVPGADARDARWATPKLVAEVRYRERTADGRLRHAAWRGWRPDKSPPDVNPEV